MEKGTLHTAIVIIVVIMFMWGGAHADAPDYTASGIVQDIGMKIAGIVREVTAYNVGVREQTSDTPCIGASGRNLCELVERQVKVCAANFVPLGTTLRIEGYGKCVVLDRTHRRFSHRVDIAMKENEIDEARRFGLRKRVVEAVYNPLIVP